MIHSIKRHHEVTVHLSFLLLAWGGPAFSIPRFYFDPTVPQNLRNLLSAGAGLQLASHFLRLTSEEAQWMRNSKARILSLDVQPGSSRM